MGAGVREARERRVVTDVIFGALLIGAAAFLFVFVPLKALQSLDKPNHEEEK